MNPVEKAKYWSDYETLLGQTIAGREFCAAQEFSRHGIFDTGFE
jgi:hypothetical protein